MPIPSFELRGVLHIAPVGEVDVATTPELAQALADATAGAAAEIGLDLRELTFMDSTGRRARAQANCRADESDVTCRSFARRASSSACSRPRASTVCGRSSTRRPRSAGRGASRGAPKRARRTGPRAQRE